MKFRQIKYLSLFFILIFTITARAEEFVVTRNDDRDAFCNSGVDCSLREAISLANTNADADTISFNLPEPTTIKLSNKLVVSQSVNITGPGARLLTITGNVFQVMVFQNQFGFDAIEIGLSGLTIADSKTNSGDILSVAYKNITLNLSEIVIRDNIGTAIINNGGVLNLTRSTVSGNMTSRVATIISNVDPFTSEPGTVTIDNSTISTNSAKFAGAIINTSDLTLNNVTISNNIATGIDNRGISVGGVYSFRGTVNVRNTIIASNTGLSSPDISGLFVSLGNNLIGDATGGIGFIDAINADQVGSASTPIKPLLGPLRNNGGPTDTRSLLPGSPALDAGNNDDAAATDQRGLARIANGIIDIGAYELQPLCTYEIAPTTQNFLAAGGSGSVTVTTQAGCSFTAVVSDPFITITSGATGTGNTTINFTVSANTKAARAGTIIIADKTFTVTQNTAKTNRRVVLVNVD
jgi:CSLREA domain-containing protein